MASSNAAAASGGGRSGTGEAERVDVGSGLRERAAFFGDGTDRLFGVTHAPLAGTNRGVVVCSSLNQDMAKNYRRELVLARELAQRGIAVQRFQYVGTGNSDGGYESISFDSMVQDALTATDQLTAVSGVERLAFFGGRFGALVAAAAASRFPGAPALFLEPITQAERFFKEGMRTKVAQDMVRRDGARPSVSAYVERLRRDGVLDLLGYSVGLGLYDTSMGRTLPAELGTTPRPVLVLALTEAGTLRPEGEKLRAALVEAGMDVEVELIAGHENWWFDEEGELRRLGSDGEARREGTDGRSMPGITSRLVTLVAGWLERRLPAEARS